MFMYVKKFYMNGRKHLYLMRHHRTFFFYFWLKIVLEKITKTGMVEDFFYFLFLDGQMAI